MFLTPDAWLALGAVLLIGTIVIGFSVGVGKYVIWLFGTGSDDRTPVKRSLPSLKLRDDKSA